MTEVALTPMKDALSKHRTTPLKESLIHVPNYPTKLTIFKLAASRFYWVRYFEDKKIYKRSTKSEDKRTAIEFAKKFYNEINFKNHQGLLRGKEDNFEVCARAVIDQQEFAVLRGEMSAEMAQADKYRLEKEVLPFFRSISVKDIDYFKLQDFMNKLTTDKLHGSTISNYMGLVNKTLKYAHRRAYIAAIPQIPKPVKVDNARGWFTTVEYRLLWEAARRLEGNTFEVRKRKDGEGNEKIFVCERLLPTQLERAKLRREGAVEKKLTKAQLKYQELIKGTEFMRRVDMGDEMHDLIVFMMNTFIRPTDLKWMQHKHIDVIEGENVYLRLRIPTSKKHNKPIVSMTRAVGVYKRMKEKHERRGLGSDNDYLFFPHLKDADETKNTKAREDALTQMQKQFAVIMADANIGDGPNSEARTLYSLRHSCIMYRLIYGKGMDLLTLARNARTSVEMIDRFYASHLDGEMNIELIQSRRSIKNQKPTTNEVKAIDEPKPNKTKKPKLRVA